LGILKDVSWPRDENPDAVLEGRSEVEPVEIGFRRRAARGRDRVVDPGALRQAIDPWGCHRTGDVDDDRRDAVVRLLDTAGLGAALAAPDGRAWAGCIDRLNVRRR
jgi:hypothetical protein